MGKRPGVKLNLTWCEDRVVPSGTGDTTTGIEVPPPPPPPPPTTIGKIILPPTNGVLGGTTTVDA